MSLRLIITRHAKSAWDTPASGDHDRPLNDRGRASATKLGAWLATQDRLPDVVLSSDAARTRETWGLMAAELPGAITAHWSRDLYLAGAQSMLYVLQLGAGAAKTVLMLGHNPGIAGFADMLAQVPPSHGRFRDYPTGATTILDFDKDHWRDVDWGGGRVSQFIVPREL